MPGDVHPEDGHDCFCRYLPLTLGGSAEVGTRDCQASENDARRFRSELRIDVTQVATREAMHEQ